MNQGYDGCNSIQRVNNLNDLKINEDGNYPEYSSTQIDYSTENGPIEINFKNLESKLIWRISQADMILGCVAWLTSEPILKALATKNCSIVVQKEDFLRPDFGKDQTKFRSQLWNLYSNLKCDVAKYALPGMAGKLNTNSCPSVKPIRCVGNHNKDKNPAWPRAHHKFIVFCKEQYGEKEDAEEDALNLLKPYAVWSGSFNFTRNAGMSFENAFYITDPIIVQAFVNEYTQIYALSEPLQWEYDWCTPDQRIGT